jgi:hypothetical protein
LNKCVLFATFEAVFGSIAPSRLILLLFLAAQAFDGVFTYFAVEAHGVTAEGNLLLGTWMGLIGTLPTLVGAKLIAAAGGLLLYLHGVHRILAGLTLVYAGAAIGPWLVIIRNW